MRSRLRLIALAFVAAAPAFFGYADFILNHFYRYGAVLYDAGMYADLAWHQGIALRGSFMLNGLSFYAFHISPIFVVLSLLSWLSTLSMAQWFAFFSGTTQASLAVAVFWLLACEYGMRRGWRVGVAVLVAIAFSFNGLAIAQIRYPHFEILIAASLILFLVAWLECRLVLASLFFVLCLLCREDAGFHVFAVLAVLVVFNRYYGMPLMAQKPALVFGVIGFTYSLAAVLAGFVWFPDHQSTFSRVYLGDPPFAHLNLMTVAVRAIGFLIERTYIFLPAACCLIWTILTRNPYLLVGYIAFIPWGLLHLLAKSDVAGTLSSYYAYPFLIASFWPLVGWLIECRRSKKPVTLVEPLVGFGVMILASFTSLSAQHNPSHIPLIAGFTDPPSFGEQAREEKVLAAIHIDHAALGRVLVGDSIASLQPGEFRRSETFWADSLGPKDTVLYFAGDRDAQRAADVAYASGLKQIYAVDHTPIRITTNRLSSDLSALAPLIRALPR